jgi:hypothetical protein
VSNAQSVRRVDAAGEGFVETDIAGLTVGAELIKE